MMKDRLSGQIDLAGLFGTGAAPLSIKTLALQGDDVARDAEAICAIIGSPSFRDGGVAGISRPAGLAAEVLKAWHRSGVDLASQLHGSYALAIVDTARQCAFLATDRFAIETLCYRADGQMLTFADRADRVPGHGGELDPQAIFDYLYFHMIPAPRTIFRQGTPAAGGAFAAGRPQRCACAAPLATAVRRTNTVNPLPRHATASAT
jgi:asparagine synthase (glutamine-hydrolysing)